MTERLQKFADMEVEGMAINGREGLSLISQVQPDVLFFDVQLPDMSGLDFLDQVGSLSHGKCRVVMCTAYDEYVLPAFRKKAFDVLLKPIDEKELTTIMHCLTHEDIVVISSEESENKKQSSKFLFYTNTLDFKLVDKRDVCLFQYSHEQRCWEVIVVGAKQNVRLKRNLKSDALLALSDQFVQINQKFIINMDYLIAVVDNVCHSYPPFDTIDYVKVSRIYRRKLIERFQSLC